MEFKREKIRRMEPSTTDTAGNKASPMVRAKSSTVPSSATIGFEAKLWLTADKLRNNMDAAEPSGARQIAEGNPQGERGGVHQFGVPPRGKVSEMFCLDQCICERIELN